MQLVSRLGIGLVCGGLAVGLSACGHGSPSVVLPSEPIIRTGTLQIGTLLGSTPPIPLTLIID